MAVLSPPAIFMRESTGNLIVNGSTATLTHNLGRLPICVTPYIVCVANDAASGFVVGDIIDMRGAAGNNVSSGYQLQFTLNAIVMRFGANAMNGYFQTKATGAQVGVTSLTNFQVTLRAYFI